MSRGGCSRFWGCSEPGVPGSDAHHVHRDRARRVRCPVCAAGGVHARRSRSCILADCRWTRIPPIVFDARQRQLLLNTLQLGIGAALVAALIGIPLGFGLARVPLRAVACAAGCCLPRHSPCRRTYWRSGGCYIGGSYSLRRGGARAGRRLLPAGRCSRPRPPAGRLARASKKPDSSLPARVACFGASRFR